MPSFRIYLWLIAISLSAQEFVMANQESFGSPIINSRSEMLKHLADEDFDVLIIGGGATGAGAALESASRGLKTALIEAQDFAFGTSSRSTKLVHGGVRYLENAVKKLDRHEYSLVKTALFERKHFLENAPHLTRALPLITPVYGWFSAFYYWMGLKMYDMLAGSASLGPSTFISSKKALELFPMLKKDGLKGAVLYHDGQFNDARMNLSIILTAIDEGASALNYVRATEFLRKDGKINGLKVQDQNTNESFFIRAKAIINATGAFTDQMRLLDDPKSPPIMMASQGSHLVLPASFVPSNIGLVIPQTKDGRVLFLLPWQAQALAGTTDAPQQISENPKASLEEVNFMVEHLQNYLAIPIKKSDIKASWSGLRPLAHPPSQGQNSAQVSRDHHIGLSESGLTTIVGGKWTTYRRMGEDVIDFVVNKFSLKPTKASQSRHIKLVGAKAYQSSQASKLSYSFSIEPDIAEHLSCSYGDRAILVLEIGQNQRLVEGFPFIASEIIFSLRNEYALHASDILARRMRLAFLDKAKAQNILPTVITIMAKELNWTDEKKAQEQKLGENFLATMHVN